MPEIGTSGSMSGDGKRKRCRMAQAVAPILDSTVTDIPGRPLYVCYRRQRGH